jgi:hypothetical protein
MRFRSKVVEIEAVRFVGHLGQEIEGDEPEWYRNARTIDPGEWGAISRSAGGRLQIYTPEGVMTAAPGDWIIRGTEGELYPCKPSVFERKYELA